MSIPTSLSAAFLVLALALWVGGTGIAALRQTNFRVAQKSLLDGSYQRIYETRFEENLPLRDLSIHLWNAVLLKLFGQPRPGALMSSDGWMFTAEEFLEPEGELDFITELDAANAVLSGRGIPLILILVPDKARIYAAKLDRPRSAPFTSRYDAVLTIVEKRGLNCLDLRPVLALSKSQPASYMRNDTHWSPVGAARVAAHVAQALVDLNLTKSAFRTEHLGNQTFDGDLLVFAETGMLRGWSGPASETIAVFQTTNIGASSLFGEVSAPVALIGTSFSARQEFHFEGFLKQALGVDVVNHAQMGRGPFLPMRDFLNADSFKTNPPDLVIWEIPERFIMPKEAP